MNTKTRKRTLVLLIAATMAGLAQTGYARFTGGSYDGWARSAMTESASLATGGTLLIIR